MEFTAKTVIPVVWGEMDAMGHVNNVVFFRYFETGRVKFCELLGFNNLYYRNKSGLILADMSCRYLQPLFYPDTITVSSKIESMGKTSIILLQQIGSEKKGLVATGKGVAVMYDYENHCKMEIPTEIREKILQMGV